MKLLILSLTSFFVIAVSTFAVGVATNHKAKVQKQLEKNLSVRKSFLTIPVLKEGISIPILTAQSVYAVDLNSGTVLYEKNPDQKVFPASTTKIITALVALDYYPLDKVLIVGDIKIDGQKMKLLTGEKIRASDLIEGLLIFSANDAAEVLAQNYPGGKENFVFDMNRKAVEIGLKDTIYTNPTGYDDVSQKTTARDLVKLASYAMSYKYFAQSVAKKETFAESADGMIKHKLTNLNKLLGEVEGVLGVKTGWTENAKENLVTYIERGGKKIMIALLGSDDRFGETQKLIDFIFESYIWEVEENPKG